MSLSPAEAVGGGVCIPSATHQVRNGRLLDLTLIGNRVTILEHLDAGAGLRYGRKPGRGGASPVLSPSRSSPP